MHLLLAATDDVWTNRLIALASVLGSIVTLITLLRRQNKTDSRVDDVEEKSTTNTQNIQTGALVGLANSLAIQAMPGPNVPHEVVEAAKSIATDPSTPVSPPPCTDPVCNPGDPHAQPPDPTRISVPPLGGSVRT